MLTLVKYYKEHIWFDKISIWAIIIGTRLVIMGNWKIKEIQSYEWKCLIWALWKMYIVLLDFGSVYSYMTIWFDLDIVWNVHMFSYLWVNPKWWIGYNDHVIVLLVGLHLWLDFFFSVTKDFTLFEIVKVY